MVGPLTSDANECGVAQAGNPFPYSQDVLGAEFVTLVNGIKKVDQFANRKVARYMRGLSSQYRDINVPVSVRTFATG